MREAGEGWDVGGSGNVTMYVSGYTVVSSVYRHPKSDSA
jgi:hypothetical protein